MNLVDIDSLFEAFVRSYVKANSGLSAEALEDKVGELYEKFGASPLKELGGKSPDEYYKGASGEELCALLKRHVEEEVPVSDYLIGALVEGDTEKGLLEFTKEGTDEELFSYAVNILKDKGSTAPLLRYLDMVVDARTDDNVRELVGEVIIENAPLLADELIKRADCKYGEEYIAEALASCPQRDKIFQILAAKFKATGKPAQYAHLLAKYGDGRAVEILKERIKNTARYSDYRELKYAIEALGGEYEDGRDFSSDPVYQKLKSKKN